MALQVLYARKYLNEAPPDIVDRLEQGDTLSKKNWTAFARELVDTSLRRKKELEGILQPKLEHWTLDRLNQVDRIILLLACCEMLCFEDIPIRVTLNEYIELAKDFGTEDSSSFVNGVLDNLAKAFPEKDRMVGKAETP